MRKLLGFLALAVLLAGPVYAQGMVSGNNVISVPSTAGSSAALQSSYYPPLDSNDQLATGIPFYDQNNPTVTSSATSSNFGVLGSTYDLFGLSNSLTQQSYTINQPWVGGRYSTYAVVGGGDMLAFGGRTGAPFVTQLVQPTALSYSVWFNAAQKVRTPLFDQAGGLNGCWIDSNGNVDCNFQQTGSSKSCVSTGTVVPNTWTHLGYTVPSTTTAAKIYINGVLDATVCGNSDGTVIQFPAQGSVDQRGVFQLFQNGSSGQTGRTVALADFRYANIARPAIYFKAMYQGYQNLQGVAATLAGGPSVSVGNPGTGNGTGVRVQASRVILANKPTAPVDITGGLTASVTQMLEASIFTVNTTATLTLPTAQGITGLVQALPAAAVGDTFEFVIAPATAQVGTVAVGAGWTLYGITTDAATRIWRCRITSIAYNSETITCY